MLDRVKTITELQEAFNALEWETSESRSDKQEEQMDCMAELLKAFKDVSRSDQSLDDFAFSMGLDAYLYWTKETKSE